MSFNIKNRDPRGQGYHLPGHLHPFKTRQGYHLQQVVTPPTGFKVRPLKLSRIRDENVTSIRGRTLKHVGGKNLQASWWSKENLHHPWRTDPRYHLHPYIILGTSSLSPKKIKLHPPKFSQKEIIIVAYAMIHTNDAEGA